MKKSCSPLNNFEYWSKNWLAVCFRLVNYLIWVFLVYFNTLKTASRKSILATIMVKQLLLTRMLGSFALITGCIRLSKAPVANSSYWADPTDTNMSAIAWRGSAKYRTKELKSSWYSMEVHFHVKDNKKNLAKSRSNVKQTTWWTIRKGKITTRWWGWCRVQEACGCYWHITWYC